MVNNRGNRGGYGRSEREVLEHPLQSSKTRLKLRVIGHGRIPIGEWVLIRHGRRGSRTRGMRKVVLRGDGRGDDG